MIDKRTFALSGNVDFSTMEREVYDVVVVGSGYCRDVCGPQS